MNFIPVVFQESPRLKKNAPFAGSHQCFMGGVANRHQSETKFRKMVCAHVHQKNRKTELAAESSRDQLIDPQSPPFGLENKINGGGYGRQGDERRDPFFCFFKLRSEEH